MDSSTYFCITETMQTSAGGVPLNFPQVTLSIRPNSVNRIVKIKSIYLWERFMNVAGQMGVPDGAQIQLLTVNNIRDTFALNPFLFTFGKDKGILKNMDIEVVVPEGGVYNFLYVPYILNSFITTPVINDLVNVVAAVEIYT